jgi:hypothetical protein
MALEVPGRLRPRIFSTFGITRVVGRQPNAPAAFTPGEIPGTHFQRMTCLVVEWLELLATNHEVPGSIPGSTMEIFLMGGGSPS